MKYILDFNQEMDLQLIPSTDYEKKLQNLYCMLNTTLAEVPCFREYGLDKSFMHMPVNVASTMLVSAIADAMALSFPEMRIEKVDFTADSTNPHVLSPRIEVADNE